jgi:hypothetical protein
LNTKGTQLKIWLIGGGIATPHAARIPGGWDWFAQYGSDLGLMGFLFLHGFNALAWFTILACCWMLDYSRWSWILGIVGFGFLAWAHGTLDLCADAQSAVALVFIPIWSAGITLLALAIAFIFRFVHQRIEFRWK